MIRLPVIGRYDELPELNSYEALKESYLGEEGGELQPYHAIQYLPLGLDGEFEVSGVGYQDNDKLIQIIVTPMMSAYDIMLLAVNLWWVPSDQSWPSNWVWFVSLEIEEINHKMYFKME